MNFSIFPSPIYAGKQIKCHYENPVTLSTLSEQLCRYLTELDPYGQKEIAVICIGTDRSTGDCLGPLVGWYLKKYPINFSIYGTLDEPVHATNMSEKLAAIQQNHHTPLIIAVDACLGKLESVGMINLGLGEIKPGAGVHKNLPPVGNIYFTGIVNVAGYMEFIVLQNTRLSIVMQMALLIANSIVMGVKKAQRKRDDLKKRDTFLKNSLC
ncbi:spore protease YyaC [Candidatus Formimonas warabiya]|uniref:Spore protease YyaC n=1 Tax=Formimonas warabiya TaxID=1761012 RepID=A0A3G1KVF7_FORW1|nr:spore protease YyaC [Candidatus Formimonas warabiya]ATW26390.1 spore protease YyaC [Candidatus Formimonas warabiya]